MLSPLLLKFHKQWGIAAAASVAVFEVHSLSLTLTTLIYGSPDCFISAGKDLCTQKQARACVCKPPGSCASLNRF